jgi:hypothetical protein
VGGEFKWRHFAGEVILLCVRWYCRYGISYRDLEEMMGERGVGVDHTTLYRWVQCYAPELEKRVRWYRERERRAPCLPATSQLLASRRRRQASLDHVGKRNPLRNSGSSGGNACSDGNMGSQLLALSSLHLSQS